MRFFTFILLIVAVPNLNLFADTDLSQKKLTILSFYSPWCAPCKEERKIIKDIISEKNSAISFMEINYSDSPEEALIYNVETIPTIIVLYNNRELFRTTGLKTKKEINEIFKTAEDYALKCREKNSKNC